MASVTIDLPEHFEFTTRITIRVSDLNYGGHLGNDQMLALMHEARIRFLKHRGLSEFNIGGQHLVVADAAVVYRAEVFAGQTLEISVGMGEVTRARAEIIYRVMREEDDRCVALGKTGVAFVDPSTRRPGPVPAAFDRIMEIR